MVFVVAMVLELFLHLHDEHYFFEVCDDSDEEADEENDQGEHQTAQADGHVRYGADHDIFRYETDACYDGADLYDAVIMFVRSISSFFVLFKEFG